MGSHKYLTQPPAIDRMPPGIPYIIGNEAAERFSYYGMRAVLTVFMTKHLLDAAGQPATMGEEEAKYWFHTFSMAVYFFPILGAIVSDWLWGKYPTILGLSVVYCAGHAILALLDLPVLLAPAESPISPRTILWLGLAFIAVGAGGIKPCVSAHVGDQFGEQNQHLLSRVFSWFYFSINLGATASSLLTPILLAEFGPGWAFGIPGVLMGVATLMFWMGRNVFVHIPPGGSRFFGETFSPAGIRAVMNLIPLYVFVAMFWALFDQTGSAWVLQAEHMNRGIPLGWLLGNDFVWTVSPSQLQAINPIAVMALIPVFAYIVYPQASKFVTVTPLRKIGTGLFVTTLAFALCGWIETEISAGRAPHIIWQGAAYIVITMAEILVSITALEFSYTQAPPKMKSFIMGLYLLSVTLGNLFTAQVNGWIGRQKEAGVEHLQGANYYWFFTGVMFGTAAVFVLVAGRYRGQMYLQGADKTRAHEEAIANEQE